MYCRSCGNEIHPRRIEALPNTKSCTPCSRTGRVRGHAVISGKTTYSQLELVTEEQAARFAKAENRHGTVSNAMKHGI